MNWKTKFTLIIWWIISFILWWVFFVINMLNTTPAQTDIINKNQKNIEKITDTWNNQKIKDKNNWKKITTTWNKQTIKIKKDEKYKLNLLTPNNLNSNIDWKKFSFRVKKLTNWQLNIKTYDNIEKYNKDLIYKLATKSTDFDLAIIPSDWFDSISYLSNSSFHIPNLSFQLSSLFDYNFSKYLKNNDIRAIPFAIDPIIWYWINNWEKINVKETFQNWKNIVLLNPNRLQTNLKISNMPLFLWYDNIYLNILKKWWKSIFPIFNYIIYYYFYKKSEEWLKLIKDFWNSTTYKTFNLILYKKLSIKYRKYKFCKNNMDFCLLLGKKSNLVYNFLHKNDFFHKNWLDIFKKFRIRDKQIIRSTLPLSSISAEYPARWRIIIINPNSKNIKYIWKFIQTFIKLGRKNKLWFYKKLISPFVWKTIKEKNISFLNDYNGRFIFLETLWIDMKNNLSPKLINFLKWDIDINLLLK